MSMMDDLISSKTQDDSMPLQEYLVALPDAVTFREKTLCWWSNLIDAVCELKFKIAKRRNKRGRTDQPESGA